MSIDSAALARAISSVAASVQAKAEELFRRAANHTTLPTLNHAFVRAKTNKGKA